MNIHGFLDPAHGPRVIAHRGLCGLFPENTVVSFREALALGVEMVELDVFLSRDHVPMVLHDAALDRTTDGTGIAADLNCDELQALDAGRWFAAEFAGERIPTLAEVFRLVGDSALVNVEIKSEAVTDSPADGVVERVIRCIHDSGMGRSVLLSSFDPRVIEQAHAIDPGIPRATLPADRQDAPRPEMVSSYNIARGHVSEQVVVECHDSGHLVLVYTVNDADEMQRLFAMGVDGVFTDRADRGLEVLRRWT